MKIMISEATRSAIWDSWKTGGASTANEIRWKSKAWAAPNFNARARKNLFYLSFLNVREARPPSSGRPGRARARARALSTNQNFKITTFLLVNFKNDHGKSCSVSRDWQPPKISAQSVPISKSYDQKPDFQIVRSASLFKQGMPIIQKSQFYYPESRVSNTKCHVRWGPKQITKENLDF